MNVLEVRNINKAYGRKKILSDVSLCAGQGECIGIVGANGCGKSTLLKVLAGAHKADSGSIMCYGRELTGNHRFFSEKIGYVPQENPLMERLTVLDNLKFWYCDSHKDLGRDLKDGIPAMFGLGEYAGYTVSKLSGGMKKRLSIACALAKDPPILILDEPGASLDLICKEDIKNYLNNYLAQGGTVIITSHEDSELALCNRMYLLQNNTLTQLDECLLGSELRERMSLSHG